MSSRRVVFHTAFRKDVKRIEKRHWNMEKLKEAISVLAELENIPDEYGDHGLSGTCKGFRDVHLEPDWVLIYKRDEIEVTFARTGSHNDVFKK